jgi:hypothetical protein
LVYFVFILLSDDHNKVVLSRHFAAKAAIVGLVPGDNPTIYEFTSTTHYL